VGLIDELVPPPALLERAKALLLRAPPKATAPFVDKLLNMPPVRPFIARQAASTLRHVHVVGAGVMGGDIAAWSAFRGMTVTLQDRSLDLIQPALDRAKAFFDKRLKEPAAAAARLTADVRGDGAAGADVVIEAIVENVEAKRALYAQLEPKLKPTAILATNTSSIRIEILCANLQDPGRLVGIHFFNVQERARLRGQPHPDSLCQRSPVRIGGRCPRRHHRQSRQGFRHAHGTD
jgi:hypothetical protein